MSCHVFRQHVGHQCFIPAPHLVHFLLLLVDLNFPQEQGAGKLFHLQAAAGTGISIQIAVYVFVCVMREETDLRPESVYVYLYNVLSHCP